MNTNETNGSEEIITSYVYVTLYNHTTRVLLSRMRLGQLRRQSSEGEKLTQAMEGGSRLR